MSADYAFMLAKRRAENRRPFTPAWDAAMQEVEDRERELFRLDAEATRRLSNDA